MVVLGIGQPSVGETTGDIDLTHEVSLQSFGGVPFCYDLNNDGKSEIVWLQSSGLFYSALFDDAMAGVATKADRRHFCLTATDAQGKVLWQIGTPWREDHAFITHCSERGLDFADIDGDGVGEIVCIRGQELLVIDAITGALERQVNLPADNGQIVLLAKTGDKKTDWTILVKNTEASHPPHEYANPAWFYNSKCELIRIADYFGAGHAPLAEDLDGDGREEFLIGFNRIDNKLNGAWTFPAVPAAQWDAGKMHVDSIAIGNMNGKQCVAYAASVTTYLVSAADAALCWKHDDVHPQQCVVGRFDRSAPADQVLVRNKRSYNQLFDANGVELWRNEPPQNFPRGCTPQCRQQQFHVFDPLTVLRGVDADKTDRVIYSDGGWPYVIDGTGKRCADFQHTENISQDWGQVPGRPDDFGYGYYVRIADFDGDRQPEVLINDRRFAWSYAIPTAVNSTESE